MLERAQILSAFADGACLLEFNTRATLGSHHRPFLYVGEFARGFERARVGVRASRCFVECLRPSDVSSEDIYQLAHWTNESLMGDAEAGRHKFIPETIVGHRPC